MTAAPVNVTCPNCQRPNRVPAKDAPRRGSCRRPLPQDVDGGDSDFAEITNTATMPVLVDLWVPWSGSCRFVSSAFETLATGRASEQKPLKINADNAPAVSQRFEAQVNSTLIVLRSGQAGAAPRSWLDGPLTHQVAL